jgi:hypothetical protein
MDFDFFVAKDCACGFSCHFNKIEVLPQMQRIGYEKFSRENWGAIEFKLDPFSLLVLNTVSPLGDIQINADEEKYALNVSKKGGKVKQVLEKPGFQDYGVHACGDQIYLTVFRPKLAECNIVSWDVANAFVDLIGMKKKEGGNKKGKSGGKKRAEEIKMKNTVSKAQEAVDDLLQALKRARGKPDFGFKSSFAELRLATLMFCAARAVTKEKSLAEVYELIVGMARSLHHLNLMEGFSSTAIADAQEWVNRLKEFVDFKPQVMFNNFPRLVLSTDYDNLFPHMSVKPYKSQVEFMSAVSRNGMTGGALIFYNAMIGAGKTTSVVPLVTFCRKLRELRHSSGERKARVNHTKPQYPQVIFCCAVHHVRNLVANLAYNAEIPFAIATIENERVLEMVNNFGTDDAARELIVSDLVSTELLLKRAETREDYILFLDEPTVSADVPEHIVTDFVARILKLAPSLTILSSATMPPVEEVPELCDQFLERHPAAEVVTVSSREAQIGCEVVTCTGETLFPHAGCTTVEELKRVMKVIEENGFLGRLYTAPVVYKMKETLQSLRVPKLLDLDAAFGDLPNLCQTFIQEAAMTLLQALIQTEDDEIVRIACQPVSSNESSYSEDHKVSQLEVESESEITLFEEEEEEEGVKSISKPVDLFFRPKELFTTIAHRFIGGCLVCVREPFAFGQLAGEELLGDIGQFSRNMKDYDIAVEQYETQKEKLKANIKNEDELCRMIQNLESPRLKFDESLQINTLEHLKRFAPPEILKTLPKSQSRRILALEAIQIDRLAVPDFFIALLFCGVGIYQPKHPLLTDKYRKTVLKMLRNGELAFLISDSNISYGANYTFHHVVIEDEMASRRSMKTIFQLMGRAGRVGKSWTAKAHLMGPKLEKRIKDYVRGCSIGPSEEARNLTMAIVRRE